MKSFCCLAHSANYINIVAQILLINNFHPEANIYVYYTGEIVNHFEEIGGLYSNVTLKQIPKNLICYEFLFIVLFCLQDILKIETEVAYLSPEAILCGKITLDTQKSILFLKETKEGEIHNDFIYCNSGCYIRKLIEDIYNEAISLCKELLYDGEKRNKLFNLMYSNAFKKHSKQEKNVVMHNIEFDAELLEKTINVFFDALEVLNIENVVDYIKHKSNVIPILMDEEANETEKINIYIRTYINTVIPKYYQKNISNYVTKDDSGIIDETCWIIYNYISPSLEIIDGKLTFDKNNISFLFPTSYDKIPPSNALHFVGAATQSNLYYKLYRLHPLYFQFLSLKNHKKFTLSLNINGHPLIRKRWNTIRQIELFRLWDKMSPIMNINYTNNIYSLIDNILIYNYVDDVGITPALLKYAKIINMGYIQKHHRDILIKSNKTIINFMYPTKYPHFLDKYIIDNDELSTIDNIEIVNNYILDETNVVKEKDYIEYIKHLSTYKFIIPISDNECKEMSYQLLEACALGIIPILINDSIDTNNFYNPLIQDTHFLKFENVEDATNALSLMDEQKIETMRKSCREWYMTNIYYKNSIQLFYKLLIF